MVTLPKKRKASKDDVKTRTDQLHCGEYFTNNSTEGSHFAHQYGTRMKSCNYASVSQHSLRRQVFNTNSVKTTEYLITQLRTKLNSHKEP